MKPARTLAALMLTLTLTFAAGTARGDMIKGSVVVGAYRAEMDQPDLASSRLFTPFAPTKGTIYLAGGTDDLAGLALVFGAADPLDINAPLSWTFTSNDGSWTTDTFQNIDPGAAAGGYLDFYLTGMFTPKPGGSLSAFDPTVAEMRISLNQSGSVVSWNGTMNMVPEPMTMSVLGLGVLVLLGRPRRRK